MPQTNRIQVVKYAPPPPEVPTYGRVDTDVVSFIGRTNYVAALEEKKFIFGLKREDRRRHLYIIGKNGVGKSKLIELLIRQDIASGYGLCFIDSHGDTIESILDFIPEERINDVVLVDYSADICPVFFNPLSNISDDLLKHQLAQEFLGTMKDFLGAHWTPRLEHIFRFACLALLDYPLSTMRGFVSILTNDGYREEAIKYIKNETVKHFWENEYVNWLEKFDTEAIMPLVNKFTNFFSNPIMSNIFSESKNKIDFDLLIKEKKIVLINLARNKIGEEGSNFLGALFMMKLHQSIIRRKSVIKNTDVPLDDFYLYIDESPGIITRKFEQILSDGRKNGLSVTLAHKYIGELTPSVYSAILGNMGTLVVFRVGGEDAVRLKSEMAPVFDVKDMINLNLREFYIKMIINGEVSDPFSAETLSVLSPPNQSFREKIVKISREKYAPRFDDEGGRHSSW